MCLSKFVFVGVLRECHIVFIFWLLILVQGLKVSIFCCCTVVWRTIYSRFLIVKGIVDQKNLNSISVYFITNPHVVPKLNDFVS